MAKYNFDVSGSQLIVSLVPVLDDVQPTSMSYLAPSFKIGVGKINAYEYGQPKQSFLFTEIGEIDGVAPTDLQDAFDKLTTATANFNGGGAAPYKVYTALLTQSGTNAPVATVLENTLGGDIVWSYCTEGVYNGELLGAFTINKTDISFGAYKSGLQTGDKIDIYDDEGESEDSIKIIQQTYNNNPVDAFSNVRIEIRVYN